MTRYKIGEIVASTGISPHTLKYYEKESLLTPETDPTTGYRYYRVNDLGRVVQIIRLRQLGLPVRDINTIFRGVTPEKLEETYRAQIKANEAEILRLREADRALEERLVWFRRFFGRTAPWEVLELPPFHFRAHCSDGETGSPSLASIADEMTNGADTYTAAWLTRGEGRAPMTWGLLRFRQERAPTPADRQQGEREFAGGRCLVFYWEGRLRTAVEDGLLDRAAEAAGQEGVALSNEVFGLFLSRTRSRQELTPNYIFIFPLK